MARSPNRVRLQMLLRRQYRTEEGRAEAISAARKLGLEVTGRGLATISASASPDHVAAVFGVEPTAASHQRRGLSGGELAVPSPLAESVERISIAPQHVAMSDNTSTREAERKGKRRKETS